MRDIRENQQGVVSILVTMIMIIVITLIVLGFAQITRRNQREALDSQLGTQAYYAAESGVNAAVNYLTDPKYSGNQVNTIGTCQTFLNLLSAAGTSNTLDTNTNTKYTCLMVDNEPNTLTVSPLTQTSNTILHVKNADIGQPFTQLRFKWLQQAAAGAGTCMNTGPAGTGLPAYASWNCPYGILRLDLVDGSGGNITNAALESGQATTSFYFVPSYRTGSPFTAATNVSWPPAATGCNSGANNCPVQLIPVSCNAASCTLQLNISGGSDDYYARLSMLYQDSSNLVISGGDATTPINPVTGVGVNFVGGQALIDSTGQAEDELRRIQVRIPLLAATGVLPTEGLQTTGSLCKQLTDGPTIATVDHCVPAHP